MFNPNDPNRTTAVMIDIFRVTPANSITINLELPVGSEFLAELIGSDFCVDVTNSENDGEYEDAELYFPTERAFINLLNDIDEAIEAAQMTSELSENPGMLPDNVRAYQAIDAAIAEIEAIGNEKFSRILERLYDLLDETA